MKNRRSRASTHTTFILQAAYPGSSNKTTDRLLIGAAGAAPVEDFEPYLFENTRWLVWSYPSLEKAKIAFARVRDALARRNKTSPPRVELLEAAGGKGDGAGRVTVLEAVGPAPEAASEGSGPAPQGSGSAPQGSGSEVAA